MKSVIYKQFRTFTSIPKIQHTKIFINNEWVDSISGDKIATVNPTTEQVITEVQKAGKQDTEKAIQAANDAFKRTAPWRTMDAYDRGILIYKLADLIERDREYLAILETLECGKLYQATYKVDIPWSVKNLRYHAGYADKINGQVIPIEGKFLGFTRREPLGVVGQISSWNFSMATVTIKLGAALAAGCTVIVKPSQYSILAALHMGQLVKEAGFPPGVINILPGTREIADYLFESKDIQGISFTGSNEVGRLVYQKANVNFKKIILMLGGKSPNIIFPDADVDKAVEHAHYASFSNSGQCCCNGSRTFVHESIYEEFREKAISLIKSKKIGDPLKSDTDIGPQATINQIKYVVDLVNKGVEEGARLELGGHRIDRTGFYMAPTLFSNVEDNMTIAKEETFGPMQQLLSFKTTDEVIERANNSRYGLVSSIFCNDINTVNTVMQSLRAGSVWINCYYRISPQMPFGGYKESGYGREGGSYGVEPYLETKSVFTKVDMKCS